MRQKFILDINPSTGELIEKIKCSSTGEIASGVKLARKAFKTWATVPYKNKVASFKKIIKDFKKSKDYISKLITDETGKSINSSNQEVVKFIESIENHLILVEKSLESKFYKSGRLNTEVERIPVGVTAVITTFNNPLLIPEMLITPAILTGNTVVFKPSEHSPIIGRVIYEIFNRYLPKGVINLLQGSIEVAEILLTTDIDLIGFVGSRNIGKKIMTAASRKLNRIIMETGGKNPMIVLKDADLDAAASFAVKYSLLNSGQSQLAVERIYIEEKISDKFEALVVQKVKKLKIGSGHKNADIGPVISDSLRTHILTQIDEVKRKGARILFGGNKIDSRGFFIEPTVISDLSEKYDIMHNETYGPVICIQKVKSADEAIEKANCCQLGLSGTVWSKNTKKAYELAKKLDVGMVGVNCETLGAKGSPYVGLKQSGYGYLCSVEGLLHFTLPKKISYLS